MNDMFCLIFDNNDLTFRFSISVSGGKDTQSRFEVLIILKRLSGFIMMNIWLRFSMVSTL